MEKWRDRFLLFYMMRVPLSFLLILGLGLPLAFESSMFHGIADLTLVQVFKAAFLSSLLISSAMTASFLVLLYGLERADGWKADRPAPEQRVTTWSVVALYLYGAVAWLSFLYSIFRFMQQAGREKSDLLPRFILYASGGLLLGLLVVLAAFVIALRWSRPEDDEAMEVFAYPFILVLRRRFGGEWVRSVKTVKLPFGKALSRVAGQGWFSRLLARLGPGYGTQPSEGKPSVMHSGFRFASTVVIIFLIAYWLSGQSTYLQLSRLDQWPVGGAPNNVLNFLLMFMILWNCLLAGLTFFVDRFRIPTLVALGFVLFFLSRFGGSDHVFLTVPRNAGTVALVTPEQAFRKAPEGPVVVVAAAGGGIQSAAWTSKVLCSLRADPHLAQFQSSVLAISGVSGGSVGALFYLRCLEPYRGDDPPEVRARDSSLGAVAWGLTHPDLRKVFLPVQSESWGSPDRGWALERSLLKSAHFNKPWRRLAECLPGPPYILFNSTDALTGDPVVFTNSDFPRAGAHATSGNHTLHNFFSQTGKEPRDVLVTTAARMSAAFPYVSPEARPGGVTNGVHLGDGGYFDNSGVFTLAEWLKEATMSPVASAPPPNEPKHRILILQLDAFPDSKPSDQQPPEKWYYQLLAPIYTMLRVRSEGQIVRDEVAGKDLQEMLNVAGHDTGWMLLRYEPTGVKRAGIACPTDPPLSWHLTVVEQECIDLGWSNIQDRSSAEIARFLKGELQFPHGQCEEPPRQLPLGMYERFCPASPSH